MYATFTKKFLDAMKEVLSIKKKTSRACRKIVNRNGCTVKDKKDISSIFNGHSATAAEKLIQILIEVHKYNAKSRQ